MRKIKLGNINILKPELGSANTLAASVFFFLTGISSGIFLELFMNPAQKHGVAQYLFEYLINESSDLSYPNPFFSSLGSNLFLLLIILVSGLTVYGFPFALLTLLYKGFVLGFSSCLIIEELSLKGISLILLTIIPQNLLLVPAFLAAAAGCLHYSFIKLSDRRDRLYPQKSRKSQISKATYCMFFILPAIIILIGCVIESLIFLVVSSP